MTAGTGPTYASDLAKRPILFVCLAALAARAIMFLLVDPLAQLTSGDAAYFLTVARSIASGAGHSLNGVPTAYQSSGYAYFLAVVPFPLLAQSLLSILVGALIARRFSFIAAVLFVTCPFLIIYEWRLLAEALAIDLMVAAFVLAAFPKRRWELALAGLLMGLAILTRDTLQYLPLLILLVGLCNRRYLKRAATVGLVAYLTLLPWQIQNGGSISDGRLGLNLWIGTWERTPDWNDHGFDRADWPPTAFRTPKERQLLLAALAKRQEQPFLDVAMDRIRTQPLKVLETWLVRYPRLWLGTRTEQIALRADRGTLIWKAEKGAFLALNLTMLVAGLVGMILALRSDRRWLFAAAPIAYVALIYIPFHNTEPRYSLPAIPFLLAFVAYAATLLMVRSGRGKAAPEGTPMAPAIGLRERPE